MLLKVVSKVRSHSVRHLLGDDFVDELVRLSDSFGHVAEYLLVGGDAYDMDRRTLEGAVGDEVAPAGPCAHHVRHALVEVLVFCGEE